MILRRIKAHVEKENWFAVFLDFCIVVIGVFVGLQVQAWAQEQDRKRQEAVYVLRLYDEVADLQSVRQPLLEVRERIYANLLSATPVFLGETDRSLTEAECDSIAMSSVITNPTDDLATLIELQQTGGLALFRDENVLSAIRTYLLTRTRARDVHDGVVRSVDDLIPDHPMVIQPTSETDLSKLLSGFFVCDLTAMREDNGFTNTAYWNAANYKAHIEFNRTVTESLEDLRQALEAFTKKTHQRESTR
ncbi:MAG: hypothetical protein AAF296_00910 [Pseudomonadota bacterium]